jgi:RHS repeat-associated protein
VAADVRARVTRARGHSEDPSGAAVHAGRLASVTIDGVAAESFRYSRNGNRLWDASSPESTWYDAQDRLTSRPGVTYTYSPNGELATRVDGGDTTTFTYDERGALRQVVRPGSGNAVTYQLDGLGRRIQRQELVGGVAQPTRRYLYDGRRVVAELDASNTVLARFVYGTRPNVPDYMVRGAETYRLVADHLGSVRLVVRVSDGAVMQRLRYSAYGRLAAADDWAASGFERVPFGFAGGLYDRTTGLVRFGARDYDPEVGRWVSKDGAGFGGGTNFYVYAADSPAEFVDPSGNSPIVWFVLPFIFEQASDGIPGDASESTALDAGITFVATVIPIASAWCSAGAKAGRGARWWNLGRENDLAYRSLSMQDHLLYEVGQATRSPEVFEEFSRFSSPVERGRAITESRGWRYADRKSTRLNSSHRYISRMPSSA